MDKFVTGNNRHQSCSQLMSQKSRRRSNPWLFHHCRQTMFQHGVQFRQHLIVQVKLILSLFPRNMLIWRNKNLKFIGMDLNLTETIHKSYLNAVWWMQVLQAMEMTVQSRNHPASKKTQHTMRQMKSFLDLLISTQQFSDISWFRICCSNYIFLSDSFLYLIALGPFSPVKCPKFRLVRCFAPNNHAVTLVQGQLMQLNPSSSI